MAAAKPKYRIVPVDVPASAPYLPPVVAQEQVWALKAFVAGQASEAEQGIVFRFILHTLSEVDALSFRPDIRDDAFAQGKRFVGHEILKAARMTPDQIAKLPKFTTTGDDEEMPVF